MTNIGFKEWLGVCTHLGAGTSSLLLRKGGIHEGRDGFSFKHERFFLFPTGFHEAAEGLTAPAPFSELLPATEENGVSIRHFAVADWAVLLRDREIIEALAPHHLWTPQVVWDRYSYSEKLEADCISVAFVRVYELPAIWSFPYQPKFGGCRSWVDLPEPPANWEKEMRPVISDEEHAARATALAATIGKVV
ncbi:MAG: DUF1802 family protein [Verrucomicrobiales bacterium]